METVDQFLERGGRITELPGFTEIKPLPAHQSANYVEQVVERPSARKPLRAPDGYYTLQQAADVLKLIYSKLIRLLRDTTCRDKTVEGHVLPNAKVFGKMLVLPKGSIDEIARKMGYLGA